jgi:hypothetical protein
VPVQEVQPLGRGAVPQDAAHLPVQEIRVLDAGPPVRVPRVTDQFRPPADGKQEVVVLP